uniref:ABC transmembrane type-1 domain-containing protein n=1 Tax=Panagrolaimus superbus TaxID=310955 RepID=A0A914YMX5_9BILA
MLILAHLSKPLSFNIERLVINNATIFDTNQLDDETATEKNEIVEYVAKIVKTVNTVLSVALAFGITVSLGIVIFCIIAPIVLSCTASLTACCWCLRSDSINRSIIDLGRKLERIEAIQKFAKTEDNEMAVATFDTHITKRD